MTKKGPKNEIKRRESRKNATEKKRIKIRYKKAIKSPQKKCNKKKRETLKNKIQKNDISAIEIADKASWPTGAKI